MQEALAQIYGYALGVWRHRWAALVVAWVIALAGWAFVTQMPESYKATARLYVDSNSVLRPLMRGLAITPNIDQRIAMMSRTLLSRPNLEKLARMTDLDLQVTTDAQKEALISRLEDSISISGIRGNASLYSIAVTHRHRETARRIAQSLITVFIEMSLDDKREDSSGAQSFLDKQIAESERRLVEAENRLARFKQENVDVLPGESGDYYARLQSARGELAAARLELREQQNRRDELQRQIDGEEPVFISSGSAAPTGLPIDTRIQALQSQLDALLARYTDKHPEVRQLNGLIDELRAERAEQLKAMGPGAVNNFSGVGNSPVYQGMRTMLAEADASVAELSVRVNEYEERVADLVEKVNSIPEVEAQLKQLSRDYGVLSQQHEEMLQRRESARISSDVENSAGDVSFRVVDPPFVPSKPSEPNKLLLNAGVLVVALGAGVVLALGLSLIHPIVSDARMPAVATGLPLLGSVTWNKSDEQKRRERWRLAGFGACTASLLVVFVAVLLAPQLWEQLA
ncbi:MAG: XrtA system polysaccharide chain length determinant [Halieaceae bacterium]|jgi:polysaccharide chain length determinant protein (PEP-CTERM system associated)|nr:XrtA system polysaccharide chain length determinant [Halieaceae bacterium]